MRGTGILLKTLRRYLPAYVQNWRFSLSPLYNRGKVETPLRMFEMGVSLCL